MYGKLCNRTLVRQYSGMYADTDKKPAVLRDFSCVDFGIGENHPFLRHNIPRSIPPHFSIVNNIK